MPTLKDCLLEGGVKGNTFRYDGRNRTKGPYIYTILDIKDNGDLVVNSNDLLRQLVTMRGNSPIIGAYVIYGIENHLKDELVEDVQSKSSLPIPLPAP